MRGMNLSGWKAAAWLAVVAACLPLAGCKTWKKLTASGQTLAEERRYGPTADQRIEELAADAKKAKEKSKKGKRKARAKEKARKAKRRPRRRPRPTPN